MNVQTEPTAQSNPDWLATLATVKRIDKWLKLGLPPGAAKKLVAAGIYTRTNLRNTSRWKLEQLGIQRRVMARIEELRRPTNRL
jgi:hypothetical protein